MSAQIILVGSLTFESIERLNREMSEQLSKLADTTEVEVDLQQINEVDSSGVSFVCYWLRYMRQRQRVLSFRHAPTNLLSLMALYGVNEFLQAMIT